MTLSFRQALQARKFGSGERSICGGGQDLRVVQGSSLDIVPESSADEGLAVNLSAGRSLSAIARYSSEANK